MRVHQAHDIRAVSNFIVSVNIVVYLIYVTLLLMNSRNEGVQHFSESNIFNYISYFVPSVSAYTSRLDGGDLVDRGLVVIIYSIVWIFSYVIFLLYLIFARKIYIYYRDRYKNDKYRRKKAYAEYQPTLIRAYSVMLVICVLVYMGFGVNVEIYDSRAGRLLFREYYIQALAAAIWPYLFTHLVALILAGYKYKSSNNSEIRAR